jgi:hypothetical protein
VSPTDSVDFQATTDVAPVLAGTISVANGGSSGSGVFVPPAQATGLALLVYNLPQLLQVIITGATSGIVYTAAVPAVPGGGTVAIPIQGGIEASFTVQVLLTTPNPGPGALVVASVAWYLGTGIQYVVNPPDQPVNVQFPSTQLVAVNLRGGALLQTVDCSAAIAANTSATVLPGVVNKVVTIYGYELTVSPEVTAAAQFTDFVMYDTSLATTIMHGRSRVMTAAGQIAERFSRHFSPGLVLPVSQGILIFAPISNTSIMDVFGVIDYTQLLSGG